MRKNTNRQEPEITFKIEKLLGLISTAGSGWKKILAKVSWNQAPARYDIREWNEDHTRMSSGITLTEDEAKLLSDILITAVVRKEWKVKERNESACRNMTEIPFEIERHFGVIGEPNKGWKKEVNSVSWNNRLAKIDIRTWDESHTHMSRGVTLTREEAERLSDILLDAFSV